MTTCALCGYRFPPEEGTSACAACPLHRNCGLVRCPNCGYEFPPERRRSGAKTKKTKKRNIKRSRDNVA
jgi:rubredoxin